MKVIEVNHSKVWAVCNNCYRIGEHQTLCKNKNCGEGPPDDYDLESWLQLTCENVKTIARDYHLNPGHQSFEAVIVLEWWLKDKKLTIDIYSPNQIQAMKISGTRGKTYIEDVEIFSYNDIADLFKWLKE